LLKRRTSMNAIVEQINSGGYAFVEFAVSMLIQVSVLIVLLFLADLVLRRRVRAVFRYWMWLLVLVKLVLPTSLSGPFSIGYWFGDKLEYADVGRGAYEPRASGPMMPALPYIDISNVPPAIYPPVTSAAPGEADPASMQPIAAPAVPPAQIEWQGIVFLLWLAVVMAMALLLAQRAVFVHGLVAQAREASRPMYDALEECRRNMKVRGKVGLKVSPNAASPAVCGLLRPVILVPQNLASALDTTDLRIVLLHELAHVKRGDLWVNLAQTLLQIVYFYNPLLWLANAVIRRAREQAVDEAVLVAMGERASRYPETLVSVAKLAFKRPALSLRLIGVVESKSALTARIKRILSRPIPKSAKLGILGLAVIVITAVIVLPMAKAQLYTDRARQVMALAEKEARRLKHEYIGTEHILLALAGQKDGVGAKVLDKLGIQKATLESELAKLVRPGPKPITKGSLPQTPRAKSAIDYAEQEAKALDHDYIGTEHILLGLMREKTGIAAQMLAKLGVSYDVGRAEVLDLVKPGPRVKTDVEIETQPPGSDDQPPAAKTQFSWKNSARLRVNQDYLRASFPDSAGYYIVESHGLSKGLGTTYIKEYERARGPLDVVFGQDGKLFSEEIYEQSMQGFEKLAQNSEAYPLSLYAKRWTIILDWLAEEQDALSTTRALNDLKVGQSNKYEAHLTGAYAAIILARDGYMEKAVQTFVQCRPEQTPQWGWFVFAINRYFNKYVEQTAPNMTRREGTNSIQKARTQEQWQEIEKPLRQAQTAYADYIEHQLLPLAARYITSQAAEEYKHIERIQIIDSIRQIQRSHLSSFGLGTTTRQISKRVKTSIRPKVLAVWQKSLTLLEEEKYKESFEAYSDEILMRCKSFDIPFEFLDQYWNKVVSAANAMNTEVAFTSADPSLRPGGKTDVEIKLDSARPKYSATLPNGVTVELVGICEYPSDGKQWWRPDGSLLAQAPYGQLDVTSIPGAKPNERVYEFAWRLPSGMEMIAVSATGEIIEHGGMATEPRKNGRPVSDISSVISYFPKDQKATTLITSSAVFKNVSLRAAVKTDVQIEQPVTRRVPEDYPTVWEAVITAEDGDTLIVGAGQYPDEDTLIEPELEFLAWHKSDRDKYWHADGSVVSDEKELRILKNISHPGCGDPQHPDYEWLKLSFSHPSFDEKSYVELRMINDTGEHRKFVSATATGAENPEPRNGNRGWVLYTVSLGTKEDFPRQCGFELDYAIGRWKTGIKKLPKDYNGIMSFGSGFLLGSIGQNAEGKATINYTHLKRETSHQQHRFVAVTQDGIVAPSGHVHGGGPDTYKDEYEFDIPLEEIQHFQFQTREVRTATFRNVSLRSGHKTDVEVEVESETISGVVGVIDSTLGKSTSAEAAFIIQKVLDRYAAIKTYSAIGELLTDVNHPPGAMRAIPGITTEMLQQMGEQQLKSIFTIKMARPNLYCIEWNENIDSDLSKVGNAWSVGDGSYGLILGKEKSFEKPLEALIWTAKNMGKVQSSLFFDTSLNTLRELRDLSQQEDEQLEGVECYVISGSRYRRTYTYWVSKKDFLIRRHKFVSGGDGKLIEGGGHEVTDETIKESLKAMDKEATPEEIAKTRAMLTAANAMASGVKVTNTETYRNIILDQPISKEQFVPSKDIDEITEELKNLRVQYIQRLENISPTESNLKTDVQVEVETPDEKAGLVWGEEVNGLRAAIEFEPEKQTYSIPEKIGVHFHIQNVSDKPIQFISESYRWEPLKIEDANGNRQGVRENVYSGLPPVTRHYLEPGREVVLRGLPLSIAQDEQQLESLGGPYGTDFKAKPGVYSVRSRLTIPGVISSSLPAQKDDWTGQLETGKHKLVVAVDPNSGNRPR
jgi:beta-lactamase regulating signal transducer with metallopeptidase domain